MPKPELQELEERLLAADLRGSRADLDELIADDFKEFGSSGRVWTKAEVLEELPFQEPLGGAEISHFEELDLGGNHVLVTYQLDLGGARSLRSSIWRKTNGGWRMTFHQGTRSG